LSRRGRKNRTIDAVGGASPTAPSPPSQSPTSKAEVRSLTVSTSDDPLGTVHRLGSVDWVRVAVRHDHPTTPGPAQKAFATAAEALLSPSPGVVVPNVAGRYHSDVFATNGQDIWKLHITVTTPLPPDFDLTKSGVQLLRPDVIDAAKELL
jgi:hypothetical protein